MSQSKAWFRTSEKEEWTCLGEIEGGVSIIGVDLAIGEDKTLMDWFCYLCQKPATGVMIVPLEIHYVHESPLSVEGYSVISSNIIKGRAEFIPFCKEHDAGDPTQFVLRCDLTDKVKEELDKKFAIDPVINSRDLRLE